MRCDVWCGALRGLAWRGEVWLGSKVHTEVLCHLFSVTCGGEVSGAISLSTTRVGIFIFSLTSS